MPIGRKPGLRNAATEAEQRGARLVEVCERAIDSAEGERGIRNKQASALAARGTRWRGPD